MDTIDTPRTRSFCGSYPDPWACVELTAMGATQAGKVKAAALRLQPGQFSSGWQVQRASAGL